MNKEELLIKWLADELTGAEQKAFEESEDYELNKKIIEGAKHFKAPPFSIDTSYEELKPKLKTKSKPVIKLRSFQILVKIAAVFLIFVSIYALYRYNSIRKTETFANQKTTIELPDATLVTLYPESKITYSKFRWKNNRKVKLDGEAFFVVAKGSKFDVETSSGTVSVLGTQFNVKNRPDYFEVNCFEGIVSVNIKGEIQQLTKGQTYKVVANTATLGSIADTIPDRLTNISNFKSAPLYKVLEEIERLYGVSITVKNVDTKRLFTGSVVHDNLEQALIAVTVPFNLAFQINDLNKITLSQSE